MRVFHEIRQTIMSLENTLNYFNSCLWVFKYGRRANFLKCDVNRDRVFFLSSVLSTLILSVKSINMLSNLLNNVLLLYELK